jgi:hypothetical protein
MENLTISELLELPCENCGMDENDCDCYLGKIVSCKICNTTAREFDKPEGAYGNYYVCDGGWFQCDDCKCYICKTCFDEVYEDGIIHQNGYDFVTKYYAITISPEFCIDCWNKH